ncbi:MAG: hypothetical protein ACE5EM_02605 [Sphingomonadales bacterium]
MALTEHAEIDARRRPLETRPNPSPNFDYIVTLHGAMMIGGLPDPIKFCIHYVPDRLLLEPGSLDQYGGVIRSQRWSSFEEAALALLTDFNNVVIPRWVDVLAETRRSGGNCSSGVDNHHAAFLSERQPGWDNPDLLSRLARI